MPGSIWSLNKPWHFCPRIEIVYVTIANTWITPGNVRTCACNVYQAAFSPSKRPGIEANPLVAQQHVQDGGLCGDYTSKSPIGREAIFTPTNPHLWGGGAL